MPLLRPAYTAILLAGLLSCALSCAPGGAVTPREAFQHLRAAYMSSDTDALLHSLSRSSIEQFRQAVELMGKMDEKRRAAVGELYGIPRERMAKCTMKDVLIMHFRQEKLSPSISKAVRYNIVDIERNKDRARIKVQNGMELIFVREGPYWKFDLSAY